MLNQDSGTKQFSTRGYRVLKYSSRSSISRGSNFSLNPGIVALPSAIACRTACSECPEPSRRTPYKDGPTLVSPERMLWQTEHDFPKMTAPRSLDACLEAWRELAKERENRIGSETAKAVKAKFRMLCFMRMSS